MTKIIDYFANEKEKDDTDEKKWIDNQKITEKIVALAKDYNDSKFL